MVRHAAARCSYCCACAFWRRAGGGAGGEVGASICGPAVCTSSMISVVVASISGEKKVMPSAGSRRHRCTQAFSSSCPLLT